MTFDEARLTANVNDRAQRLFADGYRARWRNRTILSVRSPKGDTYRLDTQAETCDCPFFGKHFGRYFCKHWLGWQRLLSRQRACRLFLTVMLLRVWDDLDDNAHDVLDACDVPATQRMEFFRQTASGCDRVRETEAANAVS